MAIRVNSDDEEGADRHTEEHEWLRLRVILAANRTLVLSIGDEVRTMARLPADVCPSAGGARPPRAVGVECVSDGGELVTCAAPCEVLVAAGAVAAAGCGGRAAVAKA